MLNCKLSFIKHVLYEFKKLKKITNASERGRKSICSFNER